MGRTSTTTAPDIQHLNILMNINYLVHTTDWRTPQMSRKWRLEALILKGYRATQKHFRILQFIKFFVFLLRHGVYSERNVA